MRFALDVVCKLCQSTSMLLDINTCCCDQSCYPMFWAQNLINCAAIGFCFDRNYSGFIITSTIF